jgi:hypothetical protein
VGFAGVALFGEEPVLSAGSGAEEAVGGLEKWEKERLMGSWELFSVL